MAKAPAVNVNADFRRAYARGRSAVHPALVTYVMKNRAGYMRLGVTSSKKIGNAPQRNRARRVIRAAFRELDVSVNRGVDIIFVARGRTISVKSTALVPVMRDHLKRLGIIGANGGAAQ